MIPSTEAFRSACLQPMLSFILHRAQQFDWTVQGFGMLRLRLSETERLQIWDKRLRTPNVSDIHAHPWDFKSVILAGHLYNERFLRQGDPRFATQSCLMQEIIPGELGGLTGEPWRQLLMSQGVEHYRQGDVYEQKARELHRTSFLDGTITLIHRVPAPPAFDKARVAWPVGEGWVDAKPRPATTQEVADVVFDACKTWFDFEVSL